jgi:S-formylglutathione hydrolase FrmB
MRRRWALAVAMLSAVAAAWALAAHVQARVDEHGARVVHITIASRAVAGKRRAAVVLPAAPAPGRSRPLLVFLHGRDDNEDSELVSQMFAGLARQGRRAPIVVFPSGGDHSFWHDRRGGAWSRYVVEEVIPQVARRFGADPHRVAIGGISMGGFGAFDIARLHPGRFCAVGAHSPALWQTGGETAPGAFDDAADFARHDVIGAARSASGAFVGLPLWLDAGDRDPFLPGDRPFIAALRADGATLSAHIWPGEHGADYWNRHWGSYMRFYARALARCRR